MAHVKQVTLLMSNGGMYTLQGMSFEDATKRWRMYLYEYAKYQCQVTPVTVEPVTAWPTDESPEIEVRLKDIVGFMRQNDMDIIPN